MPLSQSSLYVDALKKAGKTYEYKSYPKRKHGATKSNTRVDWPKPTTVERCKMGRPPESIHRGVQRKMILVKRIIWGTGRG